MSGGEGRALHRGDGGDDGGIGGGGGGEILKGACSGPPMRRPRASKEKIDGRLHKLRARSVEL